MAISSRSKGAIAEQTAASYLQNRGYKILERNYSSRSGEIDIIARKDDNIVFVEVKSSHTPGIDVAEMVNSIKSERLIKTAQYWLLKTKKQHASWQIDFVGVQYVGGQIKKLQHIEQAIC